jgi:rRNA maturation protein Nop10
MIYQCPRCESGVISLENVTACPDCGLPLGKQSQAPYTPPYTLTEQHEKYRDQKAHVKAFIDLPITKANSIMNDALSLIEVVSGKNTPTADIRNLVAMAIRIGEIAKAYDAYINAGGKHTPSFFISETTETSSAGVKNESKITESSRDSSTSPTNNASTHVAKMP